MSQGCLFAAREGKGDRLCILGMASFPLVCPFAVYPSCGLSEPASERPSVHHIPSISHFDRFFFFYFVFYPLPKSIVLFVRIVASVLASSSSSPSSRSKSDTWPSVDNTVAELSPKNKISGFQSCDFLRFPSLWKRSNG